MKKEGRECQKKRQPQIFAFGFIQQISSGLTTGQHSTDAEERAQFVKGI